MRSDISTALILIFLTVGILFTVQLYIHKINKEPVCKRHITIRNSLQPNTVDHLGIQVEVFCLEWKKI